jgi:hypothetical protein
MVCLESFGWRWRIIAAVTGTGQPCVGMNGGNAVEPIRRMDWARSIGYRLLSPCGRCPLVVIGENLWWLRLNTRADGGLD